YGPQLTFFWKIFGAGAIALWMVLATWLSVFLVLQRFALLKLGPQAAALAAPFLWTGLEYFRSELYYLRFSWLNVGYVFSDTSSVPFMTYLGVYGTGFVLMAIIARVDLIHKASATFYAVCILLLAALLLLTNRSG